MIDLYFYLEICVVNLLKPNRINTDSIIYLRSNPFTLGSNLLIKAQHI